MNKVLQIFVGVFIVAISAFTFIRVQSLSNEVKKLNELKTDISNSAKSAMFTIYEAADTKKTEIETAISGDLNQAIYESIQEFKVELETIKNQIEAEKQSLHEIQNGRERLENGLPELVELSDLYKHYSEKIRSITSKGGLINTVEVETFQTSRGDISFYKDDFSFGIIPSTGKVAWIRIGQTPAKNMFRASPDAELIESWLNESAQFKVNLGYQLVSNKTNPADYGEYTEKIYQKGDMYFITYFQYERVLETYDRHSFQYTFYIETGSLSQNEQYQLEQYNSKLGN